GLEQREELNASREVAEEEVEVEQRLVGGRRLAERLQECRHQFGQELASAGGAGGAEAAMVPLPHHAGGGRGIAKAERAQRREGAGIVVGPGEDEVAA